MADPAGPLRGGSRRGAMCAWIFLSKHQVLYQKRGHCGVSSCLQGPKWDEKRHFWAGYGGGRRNGGPNQRGEPAGRALYRRRGRSPRPTGGWDFLVASRSDAPPHGENWCDAPPCGMGADTPDGSAELGLDEGFAFVAELEGEEVAALVEGAKEEFVPFPQLLRK